MDRLGRESRLRALVLLCTLTGIGGCAAEEPLVPTNQLTAALIIVAEDDLQTKVVARFSDATGTLVRFSGRDRISASVPGWVITMDAPLNITEAVYAATVPTVAVDQRNLVIVQRDGAVNAPLSEVIMPWAVEPLADRETLSRTSESLILTWEPITDGDELTLFGEGLCIEELEIALDPPSGEVELVAGTLRSVGGLEQEECGVVLMLRRTRWGAVDAAWKDGTYQARQERIVALTALP